MSEWDRLWKEVYGDPISEIAIKTKALGDDMQEKLEAIKTWYHENVKEYARVRLRPAFNELWEILEGEPHSPNQKVIE